VSRAVVDAASVQARTGDAYAGGNPTDPGKLGGKTPSAGRFTCLPLVAQPSGAQIDDSPLLFLLEEAIPAVEGLSEHVRKR
jgi:hypothetical protein